MSVSRTRQIDPPMHWRAAAVVALGLAGALVPGGAARPVGAAEESVRILAFGDSLVHGYGLPAGVSFPAQLQAALAARGYHVTVLNGGNSGDTTAGGRARLDWMLADKPDAVLIELGANDALRGLAPEQAYGNLDAILARLRADGVPVLLTGMLAPRNMGADYAAAFDAIYPRLAQAYGTLFYPFFLDGVAMDPALNQDDGIHPNARGVAVIVERMLPSVIRLIERARGDG